MEIKVNPLAQRVSEFLHRHRLKTEPVHYGSLSSDWRECLVCMPGKFDMMKQAAKILPELAASFPNRKMKLLLTSSIDSQSHRIIKNFLIARPQSYDFDRFGMPRGRFIERLCGRGVALVIDMDTSPNFFNALVALHSKAAVRIAFDKGVGLPYYNFIVGVPAMNVSPQSSYRAMADVLGNFKS